MKDKKERKKNQGQGKKRENSKNLLNFELIFMISTTFFPLFYFFFFSM